MMDYLRAHPKLFMSLRLLAAATASILIAEAIGLKFAISAGIVAILSVASTRRETLQTALARLLAFVSALGIAFAWFSVLGFSTWAFLGYLCCFLPLCQRMGWYSAMAMDSVLISHFLSLGNMMPDALLNEAGIFGIGVGAGILVNLLLTPDSAHAEQLKENTDELIRLTIRRMAERIMDPGLADYDGSCILRLRAAVDEAKAAAQTNLMNRLGRTDMTDLRYIAMRSRQIDMLNEMYHQIRDIRTAPETAAHVSAFLTKVADEYSRENSAASLLHGLDRLLEDMKGMPLPGNRDDFEARAALFAFLQSLRLFLQIKNRYASDTREPAE